MDEFISELALLSPNVEFRSGFECGAVFVLMNQQVPVIFGAYHVCSQEQLFLLAHKFGYTFEWEEDKGILMVSFKLSELDRE